MHLWGPASPVQSLEERIAIYLSPPLFPVHLADIPARLVFHDEPHHVTIGSATVHAANVTHQGPTVGYRIEEHGKVLAYLPDHEPSIGIELDPADRRTGSAGTRSRTTPTSCSTTRSTATTSTRATSAGATRRSTTSRRSRGSSTVGTVVLFHHDPYHTDAGARSAARRRERSGATRRGDDVCLAHEGMTITLDANGVRFAT